MPLIEITCEDCGQPRKTRYKNTKYCRECRLLRNASYPHRIKKCKACKKQFQPLDRNDYLCGDHQVESQTHITCAFCKTEDTSVLEDLKVCSACARNPVHRKLFIKALTNNQRDRVALHHGATVIQ